MDFRSIHNYYEHLTVEYMKNKSLDEILADKDSDFLLDVACYALSRLPARYMRHEIDMAFYLTSSEREKMEQEVKVAVDSAIKFIGKNFNNNDRYTTEEADFKNTGNPESTKEQSEED